MGGRPIGAAWFGAAGAGTGNGGAVVPLVVPVVVAVDGIFGLVNVCSGNVDNRSLSCRSTNNKSSTAMNASRRTSLLGSNNCGVIAGMTRLAMPMGSKNDLALTVERNAAKRQGVNGSFMARTNAGSNIFCRVASVKYGANLLKKMTVLVRILDSGSLCNRTKYRDNFSKLGCDKCGTNDAVAFKVNSRKAAELSENPPHMGSNTASFNVTLSK